MIRFQNQARLIGALLCAAAVGIDSPASLSAQQSPDSVWRNFDFVPGNRVLKIVNVDSQPIGRFPTGLVVPVRGNLQVVEFNGKRWLEATSNSVFRVPLPETLGESFTIEFTLRFPTANLGAFVYSSPLTGSAASDPFDYIQVSSRPGIYRKGRELSAVLLPQIVKKEVAVRLQVSKDYAIMYVDAERVGQAPAANFGRAKAIEFHLSANPRFPNYVADIVIADGLDPLYEALTTKEEVTTRGLLFDTGSDRLRAESHKALQDLTEALIRASELSVDIEGHTDSVGEAESNQQLSERRAAAVVAYLTEHGIAAARLRAVGVGEAQPVAPNSTAEGRQENRRVVIRVRK